jgi:hypothetical protein
MEIHEILQNVVIFVNYDKAIIKKSFETLKKKIRQKMDDQLIEK